MSISCANNTKGARRHVFRIILKKCRPIGLCIHKLMNIERSTIPSTTENISEIQCISCSMYN